MRRVASTWIKTKTGFAWGRWCPSLSWPSQSHSTHSSSRIMITPPLLLLIMSSGLQAFHLAHIPIPSRPILPLAPFYWPHPFYLLQEQTDEIVHEFRQILLFSFIHKYFCRCPGPGSFPSSVDCSHFWECLGEDQVRPKCFSVSYTLQWIGNKNQNKSLHKMFLHSLSQLLGSSSCPDDLWFEPSTGECAAPDEVSFLSCYFLALQHKGD